jgi:hypothetical protein
MRHALFAIACTSIAACGLAAASCVGEDPTTGSTAPPDSGTAVAEGGTDAGGTPSVDCDEPQPGSFPSVPNTGPFCGMNMHCATGDHCCRNLALNTQICSDAGCAAPAADIACFNQAECGGPGSGLVCCGNGIVRLDVCTYAVIEGFTASKCATTCSNEFQACESHSECAGKTCTPARALTPDGKLASRAVFGACL